MNFTQRAVEHIASFYTKEAGASSIERALRDEARELITSAWRDDMLQCDQTPLAKYWMIKQPKSGLRLLSHEPGFEEEDVEVEDQMPVSDAGFGGYDAPEIGVGDFYGQDDVQIDGLGYDLPSDDDEY